MERWSRLLCLGLVLASACAFAPPTGRTPPFVDTVSTSRQVLFMKANIDEQRRLPAVRKFLDRFDTLKSAGLVDANSPSPLMMRGPGFKRIFFWLFVGFMWKWYRARFINKIPVWDRQPQWNMVITNREQEKDLKAYTCKNCGSTLFIAKNREWFFKGDTGLGGLGCFTCGAKGDDNFVMDRDRILEDVGDDDDYFDYERPLDFVTAAERRALLKKAKGDEDVANQMLVDQSKEESSAPPEGVVDAVIEKTVEETKQDEDTKDGDTGDKAEVDDKTAKDVEQPAADTTDTSATAPSSEAKQSDDAPKKKKKKKKKKTKDSESKEPKKAPDVKKTDPEPSLDDLDVLDMDAF